MELKDQLMQQIDRERLPQHIAIIMDGNGRWAKERGKQRLFGHQSAIQSVREVSEASAEIGVKYLTLYAFSTENWNRPLAEVSGLMSLLATTITKEVVTMNKNSIKLNAIGDLKSLPKANYDQLMQDPVFLRLLCISLAKKLQGASQLTERFPLRDRVGKSLLLMEPGQHITNIGKLAESINVSNRQLLRVLKEYCDKGILRHEKKGSYVMVKKLEAVPK